jgi:hypothetical protein
MLLPTCAVALLWKRLPIYLADIIWAKGWTAGFDSWQRQEMFLFSTASRRFWGPSSLLSNGYRGAISPGLKWPGHEAEQSPPYSAQVKNGAAIPPLHGVLLNKLSIGAPLSFSLLSLFWKNNSRLMRSPCCLCLFFVYVCVCPPHQLFNAWTNLYETWYAYHGTWAHLNGIPHKYFPSVCGSVFVSHYSF